MRVCTIYKDVEVINKKVKVSMSANHRVFEEISLTCITSENTNTHNAQKYNWVWFVV